MITSANRTSPVLTTKEACEYLRLGKTKLHELRALGQIESLVVSPRKMLWPVENLDAYLYTLKTGQGKCPANQRANDRPTKRKAKQS